MLYFAYGSNMNQERMKSRKTGFEFRTGAVLEGFELTFNKKAGFSRASYNSSLYPSVTGLKTKKTLWEDKTKYVTSGIEKQKKFCEPEEGYANVIENPDSIVQGALYVIPEDGLKKLDTCEGFPDHYYREVLPVTCANGAVVEAIVYIAALDKQEDNLLPSDTYLNHLLKGVDIMTDEYFQKLANQKTVSEFGNRGYSSTRTGGYYDEYYDEYGHYSGYAQYPHGATHGGTAGTHGTRNPRDTYEDDDAYWKRRRNKNQSTINPTKPVGV